MAEHSITAIYSSNGEKYCPVLECSCGFSTGRCDDWSEAGELFDDHVQAVREAK